MVNWKKRNKITETSILEQVSRLVGDARASCAALGLLADDAKDEPQRASEMWADAQGFYAFWDFMFCVPGHGMLTFGSMSPGTASAAGVKKYWKLIARGHKYAKLMKKYMQAIEAVHVKHVRKRNKGG